MNDTLTGQESRKPRKGAGVKGIVRNTKSMTERRHWKKGCLKTTPSTTTGRRMTMLERILERRNLNNAYKRVKQNHGAGGVDGMSVEELGEYLAAHKDEILHAILDGKHRPNPVLRVEIPC